MEDEAVDNKVDGDNLLRTADESRLAGSSQQRVVSCYVCGSGDIFFLKAVNGLEIYRCRHCRLAWVPGVDMRTTADYYAGDYFKSENSVSGYRDYLADQQLHRMNGREIFNVASGFIKPGRSLRIFDVGCAYGFFLDEVRKMGHEGCGIDLSSEAVSYARDVLKLDVRYGTLQGEEYRSGSFDAAFAIGTIEHLHDPAAMLSEIGKMLTPDGVLIFTTINTGGFFPFFSWKPPEHLFYFNLRSLSLLLKRQSLSILSAGTYWSYYRLEDLICRVSQFASMPALDRLSRLMIFPKLRDAFVKIPTNEMIVVAKKRTRGEVIK